MSDDSKELREQRQRLVAHLEAVQAQPTNFGGRQVRVLDALATLAAFDERHPEIQDLETQ